MLLRDKLRQELVKEALEGGRGCTGGLLVMVTRISGICGGVLLSLLASVFIFPRSASQVPPPPLPHTKVQQRDWRWVHSRHVMIAIS